MPILSHKIDDTVDAYNSVVALIIFPYDENKRDAYYKSLRGKALFFTVLCGVQNFAELDEEEIDCLKYTNVMEWVINDPSESEIASAQNATKVLLTVLSLSHQAPRLASVENALRLLGRRYAASGKAASRSSLHDHWSQWKPLSHFFAAFVLNPEWNATSRENVLDLVSEKGADFADFESIDQMSEAIKNKVLPNGTEITDEAIAS